MGANMGTRNIWAAHRRFSRLSRDIYGIKQLDKNSGMSLLGDSMALAVHGPINWFDRYSPAFHLLQKMHFTSLSDKLQTAAFWINSTDICADSAGDGATWNYGLACDSDDTNDEESGENQKNDTEDKNSQDRDYERYHYGYGCVIVSTGPKFRLSGIYADKTNHWTIGWIIGDTSFNMHNWHDDFF